MLECIRYTIILRIDNAFYQLFQYKTIMSIMIMIKEWNLENSTFILSVEVKNRWKALLGKVNFDLRKVWV